MSITFINNAKKYVAPASQEEFIMAAGTYTWVVPRGVYEICAVCIGGGGGGAASGSVPSTGGSGGDLRWGNNIAVTPGELITVVVGGGGNNVQSAGSGGAGGESYIARDATRLLSAAGGGGGVQGVSVTSGKSGTSTTINLPLVGGGLGGTSNTTSATSSERCSGGGGAGGYSGNGGNGAPTAFTAQPATGGAGGGAAGGVSNTPGGGGGGVGPWGEGTSGSNSSNANQGQRGVGGSGGTPYSLLWTYGPLTSSPANAITVRYPLQWSSGGVPQHGGLFGGGGGGGLTNNPGTASAYGGRGCVRIIWGEGRAFPSTRAGNYYGDTAVPSSQQNYTTPGTYSWTVPAGVTHFSCVVVGGGGAGLQGTSTSGKGAGGGGGLAWANFSCVPGEVFTVVAGAGGTSTGVNISSSGGESSITKNTTFKGFSVGTTLYVTEIISGDICFALTISAAGFTTTNISTFQTGECSKLGSWFTGGKEGTYGIDISQNVGSIDSPVTFTGTRKIILASGGSPPGGSTAGIVGNGGSGTVNNIARDGAGYTGGAGGATSVTSNHVGAGGGGAAGYGGNGAAGPSARATRAGGAYPQTGTSSLFPGSAASGGNGTGANSIGAGGGGVGLFGWGLDPNILLYTNAAGPTLDGGVGGSRGTDGATNTTTGLGGDYGGGGGGAGAYSAGRASGGKGGVRITWGRIPYPGETVDV
jgi:hypothetical protein